MVFLFVFGKREYLNQNPIHVFKIGTFCEFHDDMGVFLSLATASILHMGEMKFKQRPREEQAEADGTSEAEKVRFCDKLFEKPPAFTCVFCYYAALEFQNSCLLWHNFEQCSNLQNNSEHG